MSKKTKTETVKTGSSVATPAAGTLNVPLSRIIVDNKFNARTQGMDEDSIKTFAETLKREGLLQPVVVEPLDNGDYYLKAGFRRVSAAKMLGWDTITAVVKVAEGESQKEQDLNRYFTNLAENVARRNLTAFDTAMRCKLLKKEFSLSGTEIAKRVGMNVGYINNLLQVVGEGEKGESKGATLHPDILRQWEVECSWTDDEKEKRTRICTVDTMRRWLKFPHDEQLRLFNRAMYHAENPDADMEEYDRKEKEKSGGKEKGGDEDETETAAIVRASKSHLEKALEAVKEKLKTAKGEEVTRLNGVAEGLKFALGVKEGLTNRIKGVIALRDGKVTEGVAAAN